MTIGGAENSWALTEDMILERASLSFIIKWINNYP